MLDLDIKGSGVVDHKVFGGERGVSSLNLREGSAEIRGASNGSSSAELELHTSSLDLAGVTDFV